MASRVRLTPFGIGSKLRSLRSLVTGAWRVRRSAGVPVRQQLARYRQFRQAILATPTEFYRYRLWDDRVPLAERVTFLTWAVRRPLEAHMNPKAAAVKVHSKLQADALFRAAGIPSPPRLGVWCPEGAACAAHDAITTIASLGAVLGGATDGVVCKCDTGGGGEEVLVFPEVRGDELRDTTGARWTLARLVRRMAGTEPWLLQGRLRSHPAIAELIGSDHLASARVVTCRRRDGQTFVPIAVLKLPSTGRGVDNFGAGNVACGVDDGGVVGLAAAGQDGPMVEAHPITGRRLAGFQVPHWNAVIALAHRLHREVPDLGSVGWDIAITPDGPVLVEPNAWWGDVIQQACQRGLVRGQFIAFVRECGAERLLRLEERAALVAAG